MIASLDTAIRLLVVGQLLLVAALLLNGAGARAARFCGVALMLSVMGYLVTSSPVLSESVPPLSPVFAFLALLVPYCLWLFAHAIFEAPWPRPAMLVILGLAVTGVWLVHLLQDLLDPTWHQESLIFARVLALVVVLHTVWLTIRGRSDDLIERRRNLRIFFVVIISLQVIAVLVVELALDGALPPLPLQLINVIVIAVLTFGLAMPLLRLSEDFFAAPVAASAVRREPIAELTGTDRVLCDELLAMMKDGCYRETGLTIAHLARKIGYPEHQLRRLINGQLGFRNFSAFLHSYRIAAAKKELADPQRARIPVLTIALELGYASLGPFNRAFKAMTGQTPTGYRRDNIGAMQVDSD